MFSESLTITLKLTIGGKSVDIPGGQVKTLDLSVHPWGYSGLVEFWVANEDEPDSKDPLFDSFVKKDLIELSLSVKATYPPEDGSPSPWKFKGLVSSKRMVERAYEAEEGYPVLYRRYTLSFADPAAVLWKQHHPCQLYTDKSWKDVIQDHTPSKVSLDCDWKPLKTSHPVLTLGLGPEREASFYDFLLFLVSSRGGRFTYDCSKNKYKLSDTKRPSNKAEELPFEDVGSVTNVFPSSLRYDTHVLNGSAEASQNKPITQKQSVKGIRRDVLLVSPLSSEVDARVTLETNKLKSREPELEVDFARFPTITLQPETVIKTEDDENYWSKKVFTHGKEYRAYALSLKGTAADPAAEAGLGLSEADFELQLTVRFESKAETRDHLPTFRSPVYPIQVEGTVVSEKGDDSAETYQIYQDSDTNIDQYKVKIPLWDDQEVVAPFVPGTLSGHLYFPLYKGARVLVTLDMQSARIEQMLDWRSGAQLPQDTQGNQILVGQTDKSRTVIGHAYTDEKPVFTIERTSGQDVQFLELSEGSFVLDLSAGEEEEGGEEEAEAGDEADGWEEGGAAEEEEAAGLESEETGTAEGESEALEEGAGDLDAAEGEAGGAASLADKVEQTRSQVQGQIDATKSQIQGQIDAVHSQVQGQIDQVQSQVDAVKSQVDDARSQVQAAQDQVQSLQDQAQSLQDQAQSYVDQAKSIQDQAQSYKDQARDQIQAVRDQADEARAQIQNARDQVEQKRSEVQNQLSAAKGHLNEARDRLTNAQSKLADVQSKAGAKIEALKKRGQARVAELREQQEAQLSAIKEKGRAKLADLRKQSDAPGTGG